MENTNKLIKVDSISVGLTSPERMKKWAERILPNGKVVGQVLNSKTVNYKTLKPEKDGLFCERIFGPLKDFECSCGQKKNKTQEQFCPDCDTELTSARVRRYRLGYIELVSPVTHVWYLKGRPSYISILLEMRRKTLEAITYCTETTNPLGVNFVDLTSVDSALEFKQIISGSKTHTFNNRKRFFKTNAKLIRRSNNNIQFNRKLRKFPFIKQNVVPQTKIKVRQKFKIILYKHYVPTETSFFIYFVLYVLETKILDFIKNTRVIDFFQKNCQLNFSKNTKGPKFILSEQTNSLFLWDTSKKKTKHIETKNNLLQYFSLLSIQQKSSTEKKYKFQLHHDLRHKFRYSNLNTIASRLSKTSFPFFLFNKFLNLDKFKKDVKNLPNFNTQINLLIPKQLIRNNFFPICSQRLPSTINFKPKIKTPLENQIKNFFLTSRQKSGKHHYFIPNFLSNFDEFQKINLGDSSYGVQELSLKKRPFSNMSLQMSVLEENKQQDPSIEYKLKKTTFFRGVFSEHQNLSKNLRKIQAFKSVFLQRYSRSKRTKFFRGAFINNYAIQKKLKTSFVTFSNTLFQNRQMRRSYKLFFVPQSSGFFASLHFAASQKYLEHIILNSFQIAKVKDNIQLNLLLGDTLLFLVFTKGKFYCKSKLFLYSRYLIFRDKQIPNSTYKFASGKIILPAFKLHLLDKKKQRKKTLRHFCMFFYKNKRCVFDVPPNFKNTHLQLNKSIFYFKTNQSFLQHNLAFQALSKMPRSKITKLFRYTLSECYKSKVDEIKNFSLNASFLKNIFQQLEYGSASIPFKKLLKKDYQNLKPKFYKIVLKLRGKSKLNLKFNQTFFLNKKDITKFQTLNNNCLNVRDNLDKLVSTPGLQLALPFDLTRGNLENNLDYNFIGLFKGVLIEGQNLENNSSPSQKQNFQKSLVPEKPNKAQVLSKYKNQKSAYGLRYSGFFARLCALSLQNDVFLGLKYINFNSSGVINFMDVSKALVNKNLEYWSSELKENNIQGRPALRYLPHKTSESQLTQFCKKKQINYYYTIGQKTSWENPKNLTEFCLYMLASLDVTDLPIPFYSGRIKDQVIYLQNVSNRPPQFNIPLTGADALRSLLTNLDLQLLDREIRVQLFEVNEEINEFENQNFLFPAEQRQLKSFFSLRAQMLRRLKLVRYFRRTKTRPEWMILSILPVLPPDLRPIIPLDGNQVAVSDLNKLYQKVIFRNNRIKRHQKNTSSNTSDESKYAQRLLQEAVDALIENGKGGANPIRAANDRPLKSLSDMLKGKKGRFRQNLLGKRVDYSGRSVIVVGPQLKIHECGLPKEMAIELFQPFLIRHLIITKVVRTIVSAKRLIQQQDPIIWELLQQILKNHPVLLNRAPTLHRLGIQAFQPKLVNGRAILLHPLVCTAFNADFDGDQMAVHVPLSVQARAEAWKLMWSRNNLLSPATGQPILVPSQDMVLGCYYLTTRNFKSLKGIGFYFTDLSDALKAFNQEKVAVHTPVWVRWLDSFETGQAIEKPLEIRIDCFGNSTNVYLKYKRNLTKNLTIKNQFIRTTIGRILINQTFLKTF